MTVQPLTGRQCELELEMIKTRYLLITASLSCWDIVPGCVGAPQVTVGNNRQKLDHWSWRGGCFD